MAVFIGQPLLISGIIVMSQLLDKIKNCVKEASALMFAEFETAEKGDASNLVTSADLKVEKHLRQELLKILPKAGFLGEESANTFSQSPLFFAVDPIDGTSNFTRSMNQSAISVGLIHDGEPVLGVVYNPFTDEMFYAEKGCGAFLNGNPIKVSDRDFRHSVIFTAFSLYRKEFAKPCINILEDVYFRCDDFRRLGSAAIELSCLGAGRGELYFEMRISPWDVAAALAILKEAGGCYASPHFESIDFTKPFSIAAANSPKSLELLCSIIRKHYPRLPENY